jgi:hypothetical protein
MKPLMGALKSDMRVIGKKGVGVFCYACEPVKELCNFPKPISLRRYK